MAQKKKSRSRAKARSGSALRAVAGSARAPAPPTGRDADPAHLHPDVRKRLGRVLALLQGEGIPFRLFEGFRTPQRQQYLWEQGRIRPGGTVTNARAWESMHQYGLAVDLVLFENGKWSWDDKGAKARWWQRLRAIGREEGLRSLSWEAPHLELTTAVLANLRLGQYPAGGDTAWAENLAQAIYSWSGMPASPPLPLEIPERPPLPRAARAIEGVALPLPRPGVEGWHSRFGGQAWRYDESGVYLRRVNGGRGPVRSRGEPTTMRAIWSSFSAAILAASARHAVAVELIMTMIGNETSVYRRYDFTGPMTFRWEPHVVVNDVSPPTRGDYSAGPMQVLATTARWIIRAQRLAYDGFAIAPAFERRPEPPADLPLYDPVVNIDLGAAIIRQRWKQTGADPILVAAAYNAGGVYQSADNPWRLRSFGDHLDRTAEWYGDACFVLEEAGVERDTGPSPAARSAGGVRGVTVKRSLARARAATGRKRRRSGNPRK